MRTIASTIVALIGLALIVVAVVYIDAPASYLASLAGGLLAGFFGTDAIDTLS